MEREGGRRKERIEGGRERLMEGRGWKGKGGRGKEYWMGKENEGGKVNRKRKIRSNGEKDKGRN